MAIADHEPRAHEVSQAEGRELLDRLAHETVGMSGDEFAAAWETGAFDDDPDRPEVMRLVMLLPFGR
jgi:hypothetical protein